jgi:hypothetical protein
VVFDFANIFSLKKSSVLFLVDDAVVVLKQKEKVGGCSEDRISSCVGAPPNLFDYIFSEL